MIEFIKNSKKIIAISNYKYSKEIEELSSSYDCVIRFNSGSNPNILEKKEFHNNKTDVCALSGWGGGFFGPLEGFKNKNILITRPPLREDLFGMYRSIYTRQKFIDKISKHTDKVFFIPFEVFVSLNNNYEYDHPTSGLITLYYIKNYLNPNLDCVNFFLPSKGLDNYFLNVKCKWGVHNETKEKKIFSDLCLKNFTLD